MTQISMFDGNNKFKLKKCVRLISLFSGYDSQALALKYLGIKFEHWKTCEWAVKSIQALKDLHFSNDDKDYSKDLSQSEVIDYLVQEEISANYNEPMTLEQIKRLGEIRQRQIYNNIKATHNLVNIQQVRGGDLDISQTEDYTYLMTYSFPCQDLSKAGKQMGMAKGDGTRSGMLWEVERILEECKEINTMPQILLMENVPDVIGTNNIKHFAEWLSKLEELGYKNYWKVLNAKDFGIPQNRERCFMVSILGDYYYQFPEKMKLEKRLKDLLEEKVDEKYYLSEKALQGAINTSFCCSKLENKLPKDGIVPTICARDYKDPKLVEITSGQSQGNRVYDPNGLSVSLCANGGGLGARTGLYIEPRICASRGRNLNNPSSRQSGQHTEQRLELGPEGLSNTLTTVRKDNYVIEPKIIYEKPLERKGWHHKACEVLNVDGISTCITTQSNNLLQKIQVPQLKTRNKRLVSMLDKIDLSIPQAIDMFNQTVHDEMHTIKTNIDSGNMTAVTQNYRIRKLTPKECFRLMGVKDEDFEKIARNQSNSSLYHLAGDSIVVNVLMEIFKNFMEEL